MNSLPNNNELFQLTVRVAKEDAAYVYFTFEANEGLCFYSTLEGEADIANAPNTRDILIRGHQSLWPEFSGVLASLRERLTLVVL